MGDVCKQRLFKMPYLWTYSLFLVVIASQKEVELPTPGSTETTTLTTSIKPVETHISSVDLKFVKQLSPEMYAKPREQAL